VETPSRPDPSPATNDAAPLSGAPGPVNVPGRGEMQFGPLPAARKAARDYMQGTGLPYHPPVKYQPVDKERAGRIAQEYDRMEHRPQDSEVRAAYTALADESMAQYQQIKKTGLKIEFIAADQDDPYAASPRYAQLDVQENNHLWVFPTSSGFGMDDEIDSSQSPLLEDSGEVIGEHKMLVNDVFRIVHDYYGHFKEGNGFRATGEDNAWRSHMAMFSPKAQRALTSETRGQNSWVNYGPHGLANRTASGANTVFAEQKTGLMPEWVTEDL